MSTEHLNRSSLDDVPHPVRFRARPSRLCQAKLYSACGKIPDAILRPKRAPPDYHRALDLERAPHAADAAPLTVYIRAVPRDLRACSIALFQIHGTSFRFPRPASPRSTLDFCAPIFIYVLRRLSSGAQISAVSRTRLHLTQNTDPPCLPIRPIAPAIAGSLPRAADTTTLALRHGDLDWICEDKWSCGAVSVRARANGVHMRGIDVSATPFRAIACLDARTTGSAWARDVWLVRVVLALLYAPSSRWDSSCSRNERMESEASWNGAQSMTSWGGWTTDDESGAVVRRIQFPACSSRLLATSPLQAGIDARVCCERFGARGGALLVARLHPRGYTFPIPAALRPRSRYPHSDMGDALWEVEHRGVEET
ncbi:hypothetical protein DFH08DRAFT_1080428 [Mycena albidolilacea]|uniref:Uncharacterized protein n=1 Tax=Mycena albidolilacea TaxID=1033008 RepID=A0AAD7A186_9AGAR|nr:hypothetical protein DFH08DRAFT_1080428 [Mycena albidolilacea]